MQSFYNYLTSQGKKEMESRLEATRFYHKMVEQPHPFARLNEDEFYRFISDCTKHFLHLKEQEQEKIKDLLFEGFWLYTNFWDREMELGIRPGRLQAFLSSPYFPFDRKKDNKNILSATIDLHIQTANKDVLPILLKTNQVIDTLHIADEKGALPANYIVRDRRHNESARVLSALKILIHHGAKNTINYDTLTQLYKEGEYEVIKKILSSHENINQIDNESKLTFVELASRDKNYWLLDELYKAKASIPANIEDRVNAEIFYKRNMLEENGTKKESFKKQEFNQDHNVSFYAKRLITLYDANIPLLDEKEKEHYSNYLLKTVEQLIFEKENNKPFEIIPALLNSRFFRKAQDAIIYNQPIMHAVITRIVDKNTRAEEALDFLLAQTCIQDIINVSHEETLPADRIINERTMSDQDKCKFLRKMVPQKAKNRCDYKTLSSIQSRPSNQALVQLILTSHENINQRDKNTHFTLAEHAVMDRNFDLLAQLYFNGADINRALALGGLDAIKELYKQSLSSKLPIKTDLQARLKHYMSHTSELNIYFSDIVLDILEEKKENIDSTALQQMVLNNNKTFKHNNFKDRLLGYIQTLPEETQAYITQESIQPENKEKKVEASALHKIWNIQRGNKAVTSNSGTYGEIKKIHFEMKGKPTQVTVQTKNQAIETIKKMQSGLATSFKENKEQEEKTSQYKLRVSIRLSDMDKLYNSILKGLKKYEKDLNTKDTKENPRLQAKIKISKSCLDSIDNGIPLAKNQQNLWEAEYKNINVFQKGTNFISRQFANKLSKNVKKLMQYQQDSTNRVYNSTSITQQSPAFNPQKEIKSTSSHSIYPELSTVNSQLPQSFTPPVEQNDDQIRQMNTLFNQIENQRLELSRLSCSIKDCQRQLNSPEQYNKDTDQIQNQKFELSQLLNSFDISQKKLNTLYKELYGSSAPYCFLPVSHESWISQTQRIENNVPLLQINRASNLESTNSTVFTSSKLTNSQPGKIPTIQEDKVINITATVPASTNTSVLTTISPLPSVSDSRNTLYSTTASKVRSNITNNSSPVSSKTNKQNKNQQKRKVVN